MELHTAATAAFRRCSRRAVELRHPAWPRYAAHLPPPNRPGRQPSNSSDSTRTHNGHTHSGRPRVADPGPKAQVRARGDPDLAPVGSDRTRQILNCSHAGSTRESTFEPPPRREAGRCSPGLFLAEPRRRLHDALGPPPPPNLAGAPPRTTSLRCSPPTSSLPLRPPPCSGSHLRASAAGGASPKRLPRDSPPPREEGSSWRAASTRRLRRPGAAATADAGGGSGQS
jgi:hypothetical protein